MRRHCVSTKYSAIEAIEAGAETIRSGAAQEGSEAAQLERVEF